MVLIEKLVEGASHETLPYLPAHTPLGEWKPNAAGLPMRRITDLASWEWAVKQGWRDNPVRGFHPGYGSFDPLSPNKAWLVALGSQAGAARLVNMTTLGHSPIQIKLSDGRMQGVGDTNTPRWLRIEKGWLICDGTYSAGDNYIAQGMPIAQLQLDYRHDSDLVTDTHASQPGKWRAFRDSKSIKLYDLMTGTVKDTGLPPGGHDISPDDRWLMHADGFYEIETGLSVPHAYARRNHLAWCKVGDQFALVCMKNDRTEGDMPGFSPDWHYAYIPGAVSGTPIFHMDAWGMEINHHFATLVARQGWIGVNTYVFTTVEPKPLHNQNMLLEVVAGEPRVVRLGAGCRYMAGGPSKKDVSSYTENIGAISTDGQSYFYGDNAGGTSHMEIYEVDLRPVWTAIDATAPAPDEPPVVVPVEPVPTLEDRVARIESWIAAAPRGEVK